MRPLPASLLALFLFSCGDGSYEIGHPIRSGTPPDGAKSPSTSVPRVTLVAGIRFEPPEQWEPVEPTNRMRRAQYRVPDKDGREEAAELVLFYFGPDAGTVEENIGRWKGQVTPDEGDPEPRRESFESNGIPITWVDLQGTYRDAFSGGTHPDSRFLAAVVEGPNGPIFFKLVGPRNTVNDWVSEFRTMLQSVRPAGR